LTRELTVNAAIFRRSEDEFFNLIAHQGPGGGELDEKTKKKMAKKQEVVKQAVKELERREKQASKDAGETGRSVCTLFSLSTSVNSYYSFKTDITNQLWTMRYAPQSLKEICGNKGQVEKLQQWLHDW
jgi:replication factor C subunit 1